MINKITNKLRYYTLFIGSLLCFVEAIADKYDNTDTIIVARDGSGEFRNISEAIEVCRAYMDYHKVIYVKNGVYKEKIILPHWLTNIEIVGQDRDKTIITYDDHAKIKDTISGREIGTFRSFTLKVEGSGIVFKDITIENTSFGIAQAVALHTTGDRLIFINCKILGYQDTVFTGVAGTRIYFYQCYIAGTTDFIFGPATCWFESCTIHSRSNSFITAASTPKEQPYGYIFNKCNLTAEEDVTKVFLGRPWRDYGYTLFMNCTLGGHIRKEGWHYWQEERMQTARYYEYNNSGKGAEITHRANWTKQLTESQAKEITLQKVFKINDSWIPKL